MTPGPSKRSDPSWRWGQESSLENSSANLPSNPALSIPLIDPALARSRWEDEARRLEKLWKDTGREIHRLALERHRAGVKEQIERVCE